jgi:thiosulfate reductase cytochrome b subunit
LGLFFVFLLTGLAVVMAAVFNLIADLVGGVRVSVLEEEVVARVVEGHPLDR